MTSEVGRQHILGQKLAEKRELLRAWILRDHRPTGVSSVLVGVRQLFVSSPSPGHCDGVIFPGPSPDHCDGLYQSWAINVDC